MLKDDDKSDEKSEKKSSKGPKFIPESELKEKEQRGWSGGAQNVITSNTQQNIKRLDRMLKFVLFIFLLLV